MSTVNVRHYWWEVRAMTIRSCKINNNNNNNATAVLGAKHHEVGTITKLGGGGQGRRAIQENMS
jgi:hypothetical protein